MNDNVRYGVYVSFCVRERVDAHRDRVEERLFECAREAMCRCENEIFGQDGSAANMNVVGVAYGNGPAPTSMRRRLATGQMRIDVHVVARTPARISRSTFEDGSIDEQSIRVRIPRKKEEKSEQVGHDILLFLSLLVGTRKGCS